MPPLPRDSSLPWHALLIVALSLTVPIVPFLIWGDSLDDRIETFLSSSVSRGQLAIAVIAVLALDVLLPVPSSVVSTLAGARLGVAGGMAASWMGMTLGGVIAFLLARTLGPPVVARLTSPLERENLSASMTQRGALLLCATRALPLLAEAAVLLAGASRMSWRRFLPALALSNLGIGLAYACWGAWARSQGNLLSAIVASVALPLAATLFVRWWRPRPGRANEALMMQNDAARGSTNPSNKNSE